MEKMFVLFLFALFASRATGQVANNNDQTTAPTINGSTTMSPEVRACINACPVTSEYNPVCGSNNVTYSNPGRLICAQMCGVNVTLLRKSPCPT